MPVLLHFARLKKIFVGHHDRTGAALWITKNAVVRGQMAAPELKLTKKVTADEGAGPPLPRIVVERAPEAEPRRFYVLSSDIEAHG